MRSVRLFVYLQNILSCQNSLRLPSNLCYYSNCRLWLGLSINIIDTLYVTLPRSASFARLHMYVTPRRRD